MTASDKTTTAEPTTKLMEIKINPEAAKIKKIAMHARELRKSAPLVTAAGLRTIPQNEMIKSLRQRGIIPDGMVPSFRDRALTRHDANKGWEPVMDGSEWVTSTQGGGDPLMMLPDQLYQETIDAAVAASAQMLKDKSSVVLDSEMATPDDEIITETQTLKPKE